MQDQYIFNAIHIVWYNKPSPTTGLVALLVAVRSEFFGGVFAVAVVVFAVAVLQLVAAAVVAAVVVAAV